MSSNKVQTDGYPEEEDTMVSAMLGLFFYRFVTIFFRKSHIRVVETVVILIFVS